jgi:hypothetical protein
MLTVMEARRAQGFPDREPIIGNINAQWKIIGNSVSRAVALALGMSLHEALLIGAELKSTQVRARPNQNTQSSTAALTTAHRAPSPDEINILQLPSTTAERKALTHQPFIKPRKSLKQSPTEPRIRVERDRIRRFVWSHLASPVALSQSSREPTVKMSCRPHTWVPKSLNQHKISCL